MTNKVVRVEGSVSGPINGETTVAELQAILLVTDADISVARRSGVDRDGVRMGWVCVAYRRADRTEEERRAYEASLQARASASVARLTLADAIADALTGASQ